MRVQTVKKMDRIEKWIGKGFSAKDACKKVGITTGHYYAIRKKYSPDIGKLFPKKPVEQITFRVNAGSSKEMETVEHLLRTAIRLLEHAKGNPNAN